MFKHTKNTLYGIFRKKNMRKPEWISGRRLSRGPNWVKVETYQFMMHKIKMKYGRWYNEDQLPIKVKEDDGIVYDYYVTKLVMPVLTIESFCRCKMSGGSQITGVTPSELKLLREDGTMFIHLHHRSGNVVEVYKAFAFNAIRKGYLDLTKTYIKAEEVEEGEQ